MSNDVESNGRPVSIQAFSGKTVEEGIDELTTLCTTQVTAKGSPILHNISAPCPSAGRLLPAQIELPTPLANRGVTVSTRKTLVEERKTA